MKCNNCKNKPWKKCCENCKELEYSCYICNSLVKVKNYIGHLEEHYKNPDLYIKLVRCVMFINIFLSLDLEMQNVSCVFTFIDIDSVILEINLENTFINIISAMRLLIKI